MKNKKKIFVITFICCSILAAIAIALFFFTNVSFYKPGNLKGTSQQQLNIPDQSNVQGNFWQVTDDVRLSYFIQGYGETPVLIVHGGPGVPIRKRWDALDEFGDQYKFYFYDQRGCGDSTRPVDRLESSNYFDNLKELNDKLGMEQQLLDIERIRQILGVERLTIVGHSYGGFLATLYAVEFPQHVEKMMLISPDPVFKMPNDYKLSVEVTQSSAEMTGDWLPYALYLSVGRRYDYRDDLAAIEAPVYVIYGEHDFNTAGFEEYANLISTADLRVISDAGHFPFYENREGFAELVEDFLIGIQE